MLVATIRNNIKKIDHGDLYLLYLNGRGISKVEIVGCIRSVQVRQKRITYYVDDGSAPCMRCVKHLGGAEPPLNATFLPGMIVSVKGVLALSETNDEPYGFCVHLSFMEIVDDPNIEALHWLSSMDLYYSEYSQPFMPDSKPG